MRLQAIARLMVLFLVSAPSAWAQGQLGYLCPCYPPVPNWNLIHSTMGFRLLGGGVNPYAASTFYDGAYKIWVLRHDSLTIAQRQAVVDFAASKIGYPYMVNPGQYRGPRYSCTGLVETAFESLGLPQFNPTPDDEEVGLTPTLLPCTQFLAMLARGWRFLDLARESPRAADVIFRDTRWSTILFCNLSQEMDHVALFGAPCISGNCSFPRDSDFDGFDDALDPVPTVPTFSLRTKSGYRLSNRPPFSRFDPFGPLPPRAPRVGNRGAGRAALQGSDFLYEDACYRRYTGTWTPSPPSVADSLDIYASPGLGPYTGWDESMLGILWDIYPGDVHVSEDPCNLGKNLPGDRHLVGGQLDGPMTLLPGQHSYIETCTFGVSMDARSVFFLWNEYLDIPFYSGFLPLAEARVFREGQWSLWTNLRGGEGVNLGAYKTWFAQGLPIPQAVGADSVQARLGVRCVGEAGVDLYNCAYNGTKLYYDDLRILITDRPATNLSILDSNLPQSTFIDGTMTGLNCSMPLCWPGVRGSAQTGEPPGFALDDNVNSPVGDSIVFTMTSPLRSRGMGVNWHHGFDRTVDGGRTMTRTNTGYQPLVGPPQLIFRLFDPSTYQWSPWDSTELDADDVRIVVSDTVVVAGKFRFDWPPRDKVGLSLPMGFTINGQGIYSSLRFLPRGVRLQYYVKLTDIAGGIEYCFATETTLRLAPSDLPYLPGSNVIAPALFEFDVLPGRYSPGSPGSLLAGRTATPILHVDYSGGQSRVPETLRHLGVRFDQFSVVGGAGQGVGIGGHEQVGDPVWNESNYFPNKDEHGLLDSLAAWYRIVIVSADQRMGPSVEESDAALLREWWSRTTGVNGGDRCILASGDHLFEELSSGLAPSRPRQNELSAAVFGVNSALSLNGPYGAWAGWASNQYPAIDDRFAAPGFGPGLAPPGQFVYEVDGGCPLANRFDPLEPLSGAQVGASYPFANSVIDAASIAHSTERDVTQDSDRSNALAYGFALGFVRATPGAFPRTSSTYSSVGTLNRARILYKFLTGCRAGHNTGQTCWPCPSDLNMFGNWATLAGFQAATYGGVYAIQDPATATAIQQEDVHGAPAYVNRLDQNRPNPFNPSTIISFELATAGRVSVRVYDVAGRLVKTILSKAEAAGPYRVTWRGDLESGAAAASGIYFYQIEFPDGSRTSRKMTILR